MTQKSQLSIGIRVRHSKGKRGGLITGPAEHGINSPLIPVAVEGSTRKELWPSHLCTRLPADQQLKAHGGNFQPPRGYPLNTSAA